METFETADRYSATGRPYPKALTVCHGECEGMGFYPVRGHDPLPAYFEQYPHMVNALMPQDPLTEYERLAVDRIITEEGRTEDGYYFIQCGECHGSGTVSLWKEGIWRLPSVLMRTLQFYRHCMFASGGPPGVSRLRNAWEVFKIPFKTMI